VINSSPPGTRLDAPKLVLQLDLDQAPLRRFLSHVADNRHLQGRDGGLHLRQQGLHFKHETIQGEQVADI